MKFIKKIIENFKEPTYKKPTNVISKRNLEREFKKEEQRLLKKTFLEKMSKKSFIKQNNLNKKKYSKNKNIIKIVFTKEKEPTTKFTEKNVKCEFLIFSYKQKELINKLDKREFKKEDNDELNKLIDTIFPLYEIVAEMPTGKRFILYFNKKGNYEIKETLSEEEFMEIEKLEKQLNEEKGKK